MNRTDVLKSWADRWRALKAWGRALDEVQFEFKTHTRGRLGSAHCAARKAEIRQTIDLGCDLATVLHELAHLAVPGLDGHGDRWRVMFCRAVHEATGVPVADTGSQYLLDRQAEEACRVWLVRSGQKAFLKAMNVKGV